MSPVRAPERQRAEVTDVMTPVVVEPAIEPQVAPEPPADLMVGPPQQDLEAVSPPVPEKLSALMRLAVEDAGKLDRDYYHPNYLHFYLPLGGKNGSASRCEVCVAGLVIAGHLPPLEPKTVPGLYEWGPRWGNAILALDYCRNGNWVEALDRHMGLKVRDIPLKTLWGINRIPTPKYPRFTGWRELERHLKGLARAADELEALGF